MTQMDLLLWQFLQELLFYKDAQRLLLRVYEVQITTQDHGFALQARAAGEPLDPARHALGADVKGVTLHRLQVVQSPQWLGGHRGSRRLNSMSPQTYSSG